MKHDKSEIYFERVKMGYFAHHYVNVIHLSLFHKKTIMAVSLFDYSHKYVSCTTAKNYYYQLLLFITLAATNIYTACSMS